MFSYMLLKKIPWYTAISIAKMRHKTSQYGMCIHTNPIKMYIIH